MMITATVAIFIATVVIVGVLLYLLDTINPASDHRIKIVVNVIVIMLLLLYGLQILGVIPPHDWPTINTR